MGVTPQFSLVQLAHPDLTIKMRLFLLLASVIPSLQAVCLLHSCSRWISSKSGDSLIVRPGCTLEVWKDGSGLTNAKAAEAQGPQQGAAKHDRDMADRKKGRFIAVGNQDLIVKDLDTAFYRSQRYDHLNEDIESFRCTCMR